MNTKTKINKKATIKFMLETEFDSMNNNDRNISWSDKVKTIDMLDKQFRLPYRMHLLYVAYKNGAYELKRYAMRKNDYAKMHLDIIKMHHDIAEKYINESITIKDILDEMNFLNSDIED